MLSILRILAGLEVLQHGTGKWLGFPVVPSLTRPAAFLLSGMTAVAYFIAHAPRGFFPILNGGELAALYCFVFLYVVFAGPGPWSIDALIERRRAAATGAPGELQFEDASTTTR